MSLTKSQGGDIVRKQSTFKQTVYKGVIDSPFSIKWPRIQAELSGRLLDSLLKLLEPIGEYKKNCRSSSKSVKKAEKVPSCEIPGLVSEQRLLVGINDVTKRLERMIQLNKTDTEKMVGVDMETTTARIPVIFLCRRDIKPVHLCSHLLTMAAMANVKLVPLPLDSEELLARALNLHRVSVVFLEVCDSDTEEPLRLAVNEAPSVEAPWLTGTITHGVPYSSTRIKVLKTTGTFTKKSK